MRGLQTTENEYLKVGHHSDLHTIVCISFGQCHTVWHSTLTDIHMPAANNWPAQGSFYTHQRHRPQPSPIVISPPMYLLCEYMSATATQSQSDNMLLIHMIKCWQPQFSH